MSGSDDKTEKWHVIWPCSFNSKMNRNYRLVKKENCIEDPTFKELVKAAQTTNVQIEKEEAKRHPADFFTDGRIRFLIDPEQKTEEGESYSRAMFYNDVADSLRDQRKKAAEAAAASKPAAKGGKGGKGDGKGKKKQSGKPRKRTHGKKH